MESSDVGEMGIFGEIPQNMENIDIFWTVNRRNSFDPSKWPQDPLFYSCFIHYIPLRWMEVPKNSQKMLTWGKIAQIRSQIQYIVIHVS